MYMFILYEEIAEKKICSCKYSSPPFDSPNFFGKKKREMGCNDKHMLLSSLLAVYNFQSWK
jgi:hypothetical protein